MILTYQVDCWLLFLRQYTIEPFQQQLWWVYSFEGQFSTWDLQSNVHLLEIFWTSSMINMNRERYDTKWYLLEAITPVIWYSFVLLLLRDHPNAIPPPILCPICNWYCTIDMYATFQYLFNYLLREQRGNEGSKYQTRSAVSRVLLSSLSSIYLHKNPSHKRKYVHESH